jgi:fucose permease
MAIVGGAVLTPVIGLISEVSHNIALAYAVPLVAYVCVALFPQAGRMHSASSNQHATGKRIELIRPIFLP